MKNDVEYYINRKTGEVTESHAEAVEWYRNGAQVELYRYGKLCMIWKD